MEEDYGYEYTMGMEKKKGVAYYLGRILRYGFVALIVFVYAFFMVRLFTSGDPKQLTHFVWNETSLAAYKADPAAFTVSEQIPKDEFTQAGTFRISNIKYSASAGQLQFTLRYNNSTLKGLAKNYRLASVPTAGESFVYILTDADGNEYRDYTFKGYKKNVYNYRQLIFDGIPPEKAGVLTLNIYYVEDVDLSHDPYDSIVVYDDSLPVKSYEASGDYTGSATEGYSFRPEYLVKE